MNHSAEEVVLMWPVLIQPVYCSGSNTAKLIAAVVVTSQIIHTHTHTVQQTDKDSINDIYYHIIY